MKLVEMRANCADTAVIKRNPMNFNYVRFTGRFEKPIIIAGWKTHVLVGLGIAVVYNKGVVKSR